jgi:hypothetical protein
MAANVSPRAFFCQTRTLHEFNWLSDEVQPACVYSQGTSIARRWDDVHQAVLLYRVPAGFFVEVNCDVEKNEVPHLFAFEAGSENDLLEDYARFVKLPEWLISE